MKSSPLERKFPIKLPIFSSQIFKEKVWDSIVTDAPDLEASKRQISQACKQLRESGLKRLQKYKAALAALDPVAENQAKIDSLKFTIEKNERWMATGQTAETHTLGFLYDNFSFPIYGIEKVDNRPVVKDIPLRPFEIRSFKSAWFPCEPDSNGTWVAGNVPVPDSARIRPAAPTEEDFPDADATLILYDEASNTEIDIWQAATVNAGGTTNRGGIEGIAMVSAGGVSHYSLTSNGVRSLPSDPPSSGRASGLPYLGGLLLPEDFEGERIGHSLAITMPRLRRREPEGLYSTEDFVFPASNTERGDSTIAHPDALAAGQRIYLGDVIHGLVLPKNGPPELIRWNVDEAIQRVPKVVGHVLQCLTDFGAYIVDSGEGQGVACEDWHTARVTQTEDTIADLIQPYAVSPRETAWQNMMGVVSEVLGEKLFQLDSNHHPSGLFLGVHFDNEFYPNFLVAKNARE